MKRDHRGGVVLLTVLQTDGFAEAVREWGAHAHPEPVAVSDERWGGGVRPIHQQLRALENVVGGQRRVDHDGKRCVDRDVRTQTGLHDRFIRGNRRARARLDCDCSVELESLRGDVGRRRAGRRRRRARQRGCRRRARRRRRRRRRRWARRRRRVGRGREQGGHAYSVHVLTVGQAEGLVEPKLDRRAQIHSQRIAVFERRAR